MKRTLALTLAAIMLAAALTSCAGVTEESAINANIRVTSSDATDAAAWLNDRLGDKLTDRVVLGTSADGYGIEVSAFEADGFVIRRLGGEVALFARTADGLDRAARKYAKMVEAGAVTDVTYREGYRVKRIELAGRDISKYTIYCENEPNMLAAAKELSSDLTRACGAALAVSTETPAAPYIALRYVHEDALGYVGHRFSVGEDGAVIECSDKYKPQSASLAVRRFLEKNLGWMGLIFGFEDLPASELVTIPVGASCEEKVAFDYAQSNSSQHVVYDRLTRTGGDYGIRTLSCHGMQGNRFAGALSPSHNWTWEQPCWLDDTFYDFARDDIVDYIERRVASGAVIGEDFIFVDVAHGDNQNWCQCKKCLKMYGEEGGTHAAEILTWINALSDELDEIYPGLYYGIFAYEMTKKPPKTICPNEHIFVTFCYDRACSSHPLDGSKCTSCDQWPAYSNLDLAEWISGWRAMTENLSVWYYGMGNALLSMSFLHTVRDDVRYFRDLGIKSLFWEAHEMGFMISNWIAHSLHSELIWDVDMSDEEYDALYERLLRLFYGDAADDMRLFLDLIGRIEEHGACYSCWGGLGGDHPYALTYDKDAFAREYDKLFSIIERAISLADSAIEEERMVMTSCSIIYNGSLCAYGEAKAAGDTARMDELCRRYDLINERLTRYGMDMTNGDTMTTLWPADYKLTLKEIFPD